jgi:hypothetical protein
MFSYRDSVPAIDADLNDRIGSARAMQKSIANRHRTLEIGRPSFVQIDRKQTKIHRVVCGFGDRSPRRPSDSSLTHTAFSVNHIHVRVRHEFRVDDHIFAVALGPDELFCVCITHFTNLSGYRRGHDQNVIADRNRSSECGIRCPESRDLAQFPLSSSECPFLANSSLLSFHEFFPLHFRSPLGARLCDYVVTGFKSPITDTSECILII